MLELLTREQEGSLVLSDATHVKVHQDASRVCGELSDSAMGRTRGGLNTKVTALVDSRGRPLQILVDAGNRADVKAAEEPRFRAKSVWSPTRGMTRIRCGKLYVMRVRALASHRYQRASNRYDGTVAIIASVTEWRTSSRESNVIAVLPLATTSWP
jgi:hypothetical protein